MSTLVLPGTSSEVREVLTILGRALFFATSFETDCRKLALCLKLRDPCLDIASPEEFERFITEPAIARLAVNETTIVSGLALSQNYGIMLKEAREARNFIAHEAAEFLDKVFVESNARAKWRATIDLKVREVALGKLILALLLPRVSAEVTPDRTIAETYLEQSSVWVGANDAAG